MVPNERMYSVLRDVITFSTVLMMKHESKEKAASRNEYVNYEENCEIPLSQIDNELVEKIVEDFLESVFGTESKLTREKFLEKMASEQNQWILDSELVRRRVKRHLRAQEKGVHILD